MPRLAPAPEPAPQQVRRPGRHISLSYFNDELGGDVPQPSKLQDLDYLDSQLGLMAPGTEPAPPKPSTSRLGRPSAPAQQVRAPEDSNVPGARDPRTPQPPNSSSLRVPGTADSAAEYDLKAQMHAIEMLLTGILVALGGIFLALVGLLMDR
jgi:hypothetical protein